jgi:hypothetical protein
MFVLLTDETWGPNNEPFCLKEFFYLVVELFEAYPDSSWVKTTLAWYNK